MSNPKILLIDDVDTCLVLGARLKKHRYDPVYAADAVQAVMAVRRVQPDAILLDLQMPGGNGLLVLERLKSITMLSAIPVIIMTANDSRESELKGLEAGAVAFLHKPVQEESLIAALDVALGHRSEQKSLVPQGSDRNDGGGRQGSSCDGA